MIVPLALSLIALIIITVTMTVEPMTRALEAINTRDVKVCEGLGSKGIEM